VDQTNSYIIVPACCPYNWANEAEDIIYDDLYMLDFGNDFDRTFTHLHIHVTRTHLAELWTIHDVCWDDYGSF
jgi:hypothetical protein